MLFLVARERNDLIHKYTSALKNGLRPTDKFHIWRDLTFLELKALSYAYVGYDQGKHAGESNRVVSYVNGAAKVDKATPKKSKFWKQIQLYQPQPLTNIHPQLCLIIILM